MAEQITGTDQDDQINTGDGDDSVTAGAGDDLVTLGLGDDEATGDAGRDTLVGDANGVAGLNGRTMSVVEDHTLTITFEGESAGYRNSIGMYRVDSETGEITGVEIAFANASLQGSGGDLEAGVSQFTTELAAGEDVGFFIIANGYSYNNFDTMEGGRFQFVDDTGAAAALPLDSAPKLQHVADDGAVTDLRGHVYHSASPDMNPDDIEHTVTSVRSGDATFKLGFEDLYNGGDRDFDDSVFTIDIGAANASANFTTTGTLNLIRNGSFEDTSGMGKTGWGYLGQVNGWEIEGRWGEITNPNYMGVAASDGDHWIDMANSPGDAVMWQTIDGMKPGASYRLNYDVAEQITWAEATLQVYWNGELIATVDPESREMSTFSHDLIAGSGDGSNTIKFVGSSEQGSIGVALDNVELFAVDGSGVGGNDRLEGGTGEDALHGQGGNDLLAGGGAGAEWELVDGKWVYHADRVQEDDGYMVADGAADVITGDDGDDVLLGNAGDDTLLGGTGADTINAGTGNDSAQGGLGDDSINLEAGDDTAQGGAGSDTINAGKGDDVVMGDGGASNVLADSGSSAASFADHIDSGAWSALDMDGEMPSMQQSIATQAGETYMFRVDIAANLGAGATTGAVEVLWNGEVVETLQATSGVFETMDLSMVGTGGTDTLVLRNVGATQEDTGPEIDTSGAIYSYTKTMTVDGTDVDISAFAPGQAKLYQMISGQLKVFDVETSTYQDAGPSTGLAVNAIGFNTEDDMIYGVSWQNGTDALGNAVAKQDLVMIDAKGQAYRIGKAPDLDFVGDFDDAGNLWSFNSSLNRISKIDVDQLDGNGDPLVSVIDLPDDLFAGNTYDVAFNPAEGAFYAVVSPGADGGTGKVHKIDVTNLEADGVPTISSVDVTGTLVDGAMQSGMAAGAMGALFMDADGTLYAGLNNGNHDLDGSTDKQGSVYKFNIDFDANQAYAEFLAEAETTGQNDGAMDPRAIDPFAEVDDATVLIRAPELLLEEGGNDNLRGGLGNDWMSGNAGEDTLYGGAGDDTLAGDSGHDRVFGGSGNDQMSGGVGTDHLNGGAGDDTISGGVGNDFAKGGGDNDLVTGDGGADTLYGNQGDDTLDGGSGSDKLYGNSGADHLSGGTGNDSLGGGSGDDLLDGGDGQDFMQGQSGADVLHGGGGVDKLVGGNGADTLSGGAGNDHLWGGQWTRDGDSDTFVHSQGSGKDMIHDFETQHDTIDLSAYGLTYEDVAERMIDHGWALEIDLETAPDAAPGDKILLKSVRADDLDESNFVL